MMSFLLSLFVATTSLSVKVTDAQNAAVPGARVAVYTRTGFASMQRTDAEGSTQIDVAGGTYLIEVDADGFRKTSKTVIVGQRETAHEQFSLSIEGVNSSVTVTASDVPQTLDQTTKALTVINSSEIVDRDEYTLAGIVSTVPGTQVRSVGGPGQTSTLRVRGLRPDATSVLIDGMRFRDAATTQGDASSFTSNLSFISVDRIEVLRGSGSSLYGTNAAGGVVNVVTDEGGGVTHGMFQAEGGALGFLRGRMQVGGGALRDRLNYSIGFVHMNVLQGIDGDDRARGTGAQLFLRYKLLPATSLSLRYFGSDDFTQVNTSPTATGIPATNIPSTIIVPAVPLTTYIPGRDDPDSRRASRFHTTALKFQHLFSPAVGLQASYQKVSTRRTFDNGPSGFGFQPAAINYTKLQGGIDTVDVRSSLSLSRWNQLTTGYEFERETYADVQDNNLPAAQRIRTETSIRQNAHAIYFQDQSSVFGRLQISISGRAQIFRPQRPRFNVAGVTNPYQSVGLTTTPKALTADVSVSYFAAESGTKFRLHAGNAYRAPALYERFGGGFSTIQATGELVFSPWGDPTLRPDRYNSVDGGIDQYLWHDRVRLSSSYFYTRVASITAFDSGTVIRPATDPYSRSSGYINGSGGLSRGLELSAESRPAANLTLSGSYTYTRAHMDRDITVPGFWRVLGIPRHSITLFATRSVGPRLDVATDLAAISEMYGNFTAAGRPRAYRYPGFTKVDVSARYSLTQSDHGGLRLTMRIENVLNKAYYDLGWRAARATFVGGLSYQF